jgi:hypothetical protein
MTSVFSGLPNDVIIKIVKETQREAFKTEQEELKKNLHEELAFYEYWKLKKYIALNAEDSDSDSDDEPFSDDDSDDEEQEGIGKGSYPWLDDPYPLGGWEETSWSGRPIPRRYPIGMETDDEEWENELDETA